MLAGTATPLVVTFTVLARAQEPPVESAPPAVPAEPPAPGVVPSAEAPPAPPPEPVKKELAPDKVTLDETAPPPPPKKKDLKPDSVTLEETPEVPPARRRSRAPRRAAPRRAEPAAQAPIVEEAPRRAPKALPEEPPPVEKKDDDDGDGLLGPFRIGPMLGVGLPGLLSFGGMIKITRYVGAGVNIGLIPAVRVSFYGEAELSYQEYDAYGRIFPFGGMFFAGAGVGYATMRGRLHAQYDVSAYQAQAPGLPNPLYIDSEGSVRTLVLTPQIGLLHTFGSGFTIGIDVGAQVPIAPSETSFETKLPPTIPTEVDTKYVKPTDAKVRDTLDTVGRTILPTVNLRIGWLL